MSSKYTMFPTRYNTLFEFYKKHVSTFWTTEEVKLKEDLVDWNEKLNDNERYFLKNVLAFFAASDGIVNENLVVNFYNQVEIPEARAFYTIQMLMETIHCVAPNTILYTDKGQIKIKDLKNKYVNVWNGKEFSNVLVRKTGVNQTLYRVTLSNGQVLDCTSEHRWKDHTHTQLLTNELKTGTRLYSDWSYPKSLDSDKVNLTWLSTYYRRHGKVLRDQDKQSDCLLFTANLKTLRVIQVVLSELGIHSSVKEATLTSDPHLLVPSRSTSKLVKSFPESWVSEFDVDMSLEQGQLDLSVQKVKRLSKTSDTYCFNEPKNHTGIFNGIYTGQSEQYSLLIDTYIRDQSEKDELFNAIERIPAVKKKAEWAISWIDDGREACTDFLKEYREIEKMLVESGSHLAPAMTALVRDKPCFEKRLLAFICVEGIFFSGSFCAIYWLKNRGLMPGLSTANQFISRDENLHAEFAIELYKLTCTRIDQEIVHEIFRQAVDIEKEFVTESLPVSLLGMNCKSMTQYIEYVCDRWLVLLGYGKIYNASNPFPFMELISLGTKENFFEVDVTEYSRPGIGLSEEDRSFGFDDDF